MLKVILFISGVILITFSFQGAENITELDFPELIVGLGLLLSTLINTKGRK